MAEILVVYLGPLFIGAGLGQNYYKKERPDGAKGSIIVAILIAIVSFVVMAIIASIALRALNEL